MQATCSPSCCPSHSRAAAWSSRRGARAVSRFQPGNKQTASPQQRPASSTEASKPAELVGIPAPQELAASVMLVPKKSAQADLMQQASATGSPLNSFLVKCRLAWNLFFPPGETSAATRQLSPKELGKQRLSMILVADRCGLSTHSLVEMKRSTLAALQDCMDLEDLQDAHLRFTMTRENGVTYSMAVPILRPDADTDLEEGEEGFEDEAVPDAAAAATAAWGPSVSWAEEGQEQQGYEAAAGDEDGSGVEDGAVAGMCWEELPGVDGLVAPGELTAAELAQADGLPAAAAAKPASWAAAVVTEAAGGSSATRPASRAASRASGSRARGAASPAAAAAAAAAQAEAELLLSADEGQQQQQEQSAVMTPDMLKELLVQELVHDVEELVEHMGPQALETSPEPTATVAGPGVLAEQLEAAVAEVQHLGEGAGSGPLGANQQQQQ